MLTRIEIDGFKSFEDFSVDLSPFTVVLGGNGTGKSNLFDAIQLLSQLATHDLRTGTQNLRGSVEELFRWRSPGDTATEMRFAVEVVVEPRGRDPLGAEVELTHTRIRYELTIARQRDEHGDERLVVTHERAAPIQKKHDQWRPFGEKPSEEFEEKYLRSLRRNAWLETVGDDDRRSFKIHPDGHGGRTLQAQVAERTVLSILSTAEFPHLFALREELRSWRFLQLDPAALRRPSPMKGPDELLPNGSSLAAVLNRLRVRTRDEHHPQGILTDISGSLSSIIPGVLKVDVERDDYNNEYRVWIEFSNGFRFPTRIVSDGTLRVLALLTPLSDPDSQGVLCFEEPENGVHPARLRSLVELLRDLVSDPTASDIDPQIPLSQLLMNSHSPVVLSSLLSAAREDSLPSQILFADLVSVVDPQAKQIRRRTRFRPVRAGGQLQITGWEGETWVSAGEVRHYLDTVDHEG